MRDEFIKSTMQAIEQSLRDMPENVFADYYNGDAKLEWWVKNTFVSGGNAAKHCCFRIRKGSNFESEVPPEKLTHF